MPSVDFALTDKLSEALARLSEEGQPLYELIVPKRRIIDDLSEAPDDAEFVAARGDAKSLERLARLEQLRAVWVNAPTLGFFRACSRAPRLRALYAAHLKNLSEIPIAGAPVLEHLMLSWGTRVVDVSFLGELPTLRTLFLDDLKRLDLNTLPEMPNVTGLNLGGGIWSTMKVESLWPLTRLPNLRYLKIVSLRSQDGSLEPLSKLKHLREISLPNYFPLEEFARLAGALPNTRGNVLTPFFTPTDGTTHQSITAIFSCKKCGGPRYMMTGTPAVHLCPNCDKTKMDRRIARWEEFRSSSWAA